MLVHWVGWRCFSMTNSPFNQLRNWWFQSTLCWKTIKHRGKNLPFVENQMNQRVRCYPPVTRKAIESTNWVSGTNEKEIGIVFVRPTLDKWYLDSMSIQLWFMVDITIVNGVYKPTYNWGAPSCVYICISIYVCVYTSPYGSKYYLRRYFYQPPVISHTSPKSYDWIHKVSRYGHFKREAPWVTSGFRTHPKDNPLHMKELRDLK